MQCARGRPAFKDVQPTTFVCVCLQQVGNVVIISLGAVDYPRSYNTRGSAHIWPIGFTSRRMCKPVCGDSQHRVWFESTILAHPDKEDECIFRVRQMRSGSEAYRSDSTSRSNKGEEQREKPDIAKRM